MAKKQDRSELGLAVIGRVFVVLMVALALAAGYWFARGEMAKAPSAVLDDAAQTSTTISSDETADWETYTNTKYGYRIQYPPHWEYVVQGDDLVEFREVGKTYSVEGLESYAIAIFIDAENGGTTAQALAQARKDADVAFGSSAAISDVTVDGIAAAQIEDYMGVSTLVVQGTQTTSLTMPNFGDDASNASIRTVYDQMLTTLTFNN